MPDLVVHYAPSLSIHKEPMRRVAIGLLENNALLLNYSGSIGT